MTKPIRCSFIRATSGGFKFAGRVILSVFFLIAFSKQYSFGQITSTATGGNWSATTTWVGGIVPGANAAVRVVTGATVSVDINTAVVGNIEVQAGAILTVLNTATATLSYNGTMTVAGRLNNYGGIVQAASSNKAFTMTGTGTYEHNPRNLTLIDESIFQKSNEAFASTTTLIIKKWYDLNLGLGDVTRVNGNFGNVVMNIPDLTYWEQNDDFMDASTGVQRVFGKLTVSSGTVRMDDGVTAATASTYMQFEDVEINGTGNVIFASGAPRPFVLITKNFTDISTSASPTIIMDYVYGITQWTVTGNVILGHSFKAISGTGVSPGGSMIAQISGNLTIQGTSLTDIRFITQANAPLTLTVTGSTYITGTPGFFRFIDGNAGAFNYTTTDLIVSGGIDNILLGGNGLVPNYTGIPSINITRDFIINGVSNTTIMNSATTTQKLRLRIGDDFQQNATNSNFTIARSLGAVTMYVTDSISLNAGKFIGQIDTTNSAIDSIFTAGSFFMNSPNVSDYFRINYGTGATYFRCNGNFNLSGAPTGGGLGFVGKYASSGAMNFSVGTIYTQTASRFAGIYNNRSTITTGSLTFAVATNFNFSASTGASYFRGIDNIVTPNAGIVTFTVGNFNYGGGNFAGYYSAHNAGLASTFSATGLMQITFTNAATDTCAFIGYNTIGSAVSNMRLNLSVGGNFNITGPAGLFISNLADGTETINITGSANISGGKNYFNPSLLPYPFAPHPVNMNIGTDLQVYGGTTSLSNGNDSLKATIGGSLIISLGDLTMQNGNKGAIINVLGGMNMTGGLLYLHNSTSSSNEAVTLTINSDNNLIGDFTHSAGTINFDNVSPSVINSLVINSPNITYSGNGSMTMALPGTNSVSGIIKYGRAGISNFIRSGTTHSIQQLQQQILSGCTLTVQSGNLQIASHTTNGLSGWVQVLSGGILDLKTNQIISNGLQPYSIATVSSLGRLKTARTQGLYDGTTAAAINAVSGANLTGMNYLLGVNSTVEYNGIDNQVITGIGTGIATSAIHKYSNLDINFQGTPDVEFVYPTASPNSRSVYVRGNLVLTAGELNLDNDHIATSGGRSIIIERDSITAITRTAGYIRSESYDSSASVIWKVGSRIGQHIIPFGYNAANYIPFTFDLATGTADTLFASTYHTPASNNLPYPPSVPHVHDLLGNDNSAYTVDRFWYIRTTGTGSTANLRFACTAAELGTIANPKAQCWITTGVPGWQYPIQGTQSNITYGTYVGGANYYPLNWWTLAGQANPLPVSLLSFTSDCNNSKVELQWSTATEINNDFFSILKSNDGNDFQTIGTVDGSGNSNSTRNYKFLDRYSDGKEAFYKLIQTDFDGHETTYGPIRAFACNGNTSFSAQAFQTSASELSVLIRNPEVGHVTITILSTEGKIVTRRVVEVESGLNITTFDTAHLASGIYFVNIAGSDKMETVKVSITGLN